MGKGGTRSETKNKGGEEPSLQTRELIKG